jgi:hypothetical protein
MKNHKVVSLNNLPSRSPFPTTISFITALCYFKAPEWLFGMAGLLLLLMWIAYFVNRSSETKTDIFKEL